MKQVTLLFLRREGEILLAMKKRDFGKGKWNGVGGKVDRGETVAEAAVRECQEEIGVTPRGLQLAGHLKFYATDDPNFLHDAVIYVATEWDGDPQTTDEMEPRWFAENEIPYDQMWPDDEIWMPMFLKGQLFAGDVTVSTTAGGARVSSHTIKAVDNLEEPETWHESDSLHDLTKLVWNHLEERDWDHPAPRSLAVSISLEANELLEHYQWRDEPVGDKTALSEELADVLIYALQYAHATGIDPGSAIRDKIAKAERKYPAELFKGKSPKDIHETYIATRNNFRKKKKGL
jgi:8-oxo-dGTP diphosphatase